ncbi:SMI1/KNR4 family protein [Porphyromonas macacae]|uniref:SMI1/KNR4 family protein n=1 Tax=Porphyromonas macacae TaxID=28115 RepID=UPI000B10EDAD|nr:SMI1/KNR4 family protein [Porphyromonas macacae]
MNKEEIRKNIHELEERLNIIFPQLYIDFLSEINDGDVFEIDNSGVSCILTLIWRKETEHIK